jgi:hypothetical protein
MRYALVIAMLLGSALLARAEPIDRDKWIAQTGKASKSCLAKFRQKIRGRQGPQLLKLYDRSNQHGDR